MARTGELRTLVAAGSHVRFPPIADTLAAWESTGMVTPGEALTRSFSWQSVRRYLTVAVIVGTILNGINQGDAILADQPLVVWKLLLTYAVPFAVASYGSYAAYRST